MTEYEIGVQNERGKVMRFLHGIAMDALHEAEISVSVEKQRSLESLSDFIEGCCRDIGNGDHDDQRRVQSKDS